MFNYGNIACYPIIRIQSKTWASFKKKFFLLRN